MAEVQYQRRKNPVMVALVVLFAGLSTLMTYLWYNRGAEIATLTAEKDKVTKERDALYNLIPESERGEMAGGMVEEMQAMVENYKMLQEKGRPEDQAALAEQKAKLESTIAEMKRNKRLSGAEIAKYKAEIETMRKIMIGYIKQIDELNTKNYQLTEDLDKTTSELKETTTDRDNLKTENEGNKAELSKARKLVVTSIKSTGLRMKLNDTPEPTTKSRNCVQAVSNFTIGENAVTSAGSKSVYMQIIDPSGRVLQGRTGGSTTIDGGSIMYSAKREVNYSNKALDVSIYYDFNGEEPVSGSYKVKIYCDGNLIGSDSFSLR